MFVYHVKVSAAAACVCLCVHITILCMNFMHNTLSTPRIGSIYNAYTTLHHFLNISLDEQRSIMGIHEKLCSRKFPIIQVMVGG